MTKNICKKVLHSEAAWLMMCGVEREDPHDRNHKHKMNSLLAKIANELIMTGVAKDSAARIACSVVIKQLTENGMDLPKAFDLVFGIDAYKNFAGEIFETINA